MKRIKDGCSCLLILTSWLLAMSLPGWSADSGGDKIPHRVPEVTSKIKVDARLDETVWQEALVLDLKYEVEPGKNIAPPVKTEVLLAYTQDYLYAAFRAHDPKPKAIRARYTDRDHIWEDDYVGIVLDTFNDSRRTYDFYCNPFGVQADQFQNSIGGIGEWDAIWSSAGRITDEGYVVEMAIPFSSLRFQKKAGEQVWGIDAVRSYPRKHNYMIGLFPRDRSDFCYICSAEKIIGFKGATPGNNIELDPTLTTTLTRERADFPAGDFQEKRSDVEPGITARWGFTPNMTLTAAVNPDFSHVEADAAQLDINTQFALYYPERRPFFLEGDSIFRTRLYAIYSRTLAEPDWGAKITGKWGGNALGVFSVQDNITNLLFPTSQGSISTSLGQSNISTAVRYRRDIGRDSILGFVVTDREGDDYYNRLVALDGDLRITKSNRIMFQLLGSQTRYPDQVASDFNQPLGRFSGWAYDFFYYHRTEHFMLHFQYQSINPDFRADLGFMPQTNFGFLNTGFSYIWRKGHGHWYTFLRTGACLRTEYDHDKNLIYKFYRFFLAYLGPLQSDLLILLDVGDRGFMGQKFKDTKLTLNLKLHPSGPLYLGFQGLYGDQVDFDNVRQGKILRANPILTWKIGSHLYLGVDHIYETLDVEDQRLYTANLSNVRLVYQFNRRAYLRTILQYAHYDYNAALYTFPVEPKFRNLFTQVLFSYKLNPRTVLFLGYSDDHYGYLNIPLTQNNYTLFLKLGYALVL